MTASPRTLSSEAWWEVATRSAGTILRALGADTRATKIHTAKEGGGWETQGYSKGMWEFSAAPFVAGSLREFGAALEAAASDPRALLVAEVPRSGARLDRLLRRVHGPDAGLTCSLTGTSWVCWEIDGLASEVPADVDPRLHADRDADYVRWWLRTHLPEPFATASAVLQWSSSAFVNGKLSMHLWQWLTRPVSRDAIHAYMEAHKRDNPPHWRRYIDTTIWDGARVHYIADPIFKDADGSTLPDPLKGRRWQWVEGTAAEAEPPAEWLDQLSWEDMLERQREAAAEAKERAAQARAQTLAEAQARRGSGGAGGEGSAGDETGALVEVAMLGCPLEDLDPKRVLAWALRAVESQAAKVSMAAVGVRHATIREAGFILGNILAGLEAVGWALDAATAQRVDWAGGVAQVERAVERAEQAAADSGSDGGAVTFQWAVRIGRETAVVPDYRLQERYRPSVLAAKKAARGSGGGKVVQLRRVSLPAYEGQEAVDTMIEVMVDEEAEAKAAARALRPARQDWHGQPCDTDLALRALDEMDAQAGGVAVVNDEGYIWQYQPAKGIYTAWEQADFTRLVTRWHGDTFEGPPDKKTGEVSTQKVKVTASKAKGAHWMAEQQRARPGFFGEAARGFVTSDRVFVSANTRTGEVKEAPASADSRARAALGCRYNPDAKGPLLTHYLSTVHAGQPDEAERVRLMGEVGFVALMGLGPWLNKALIAYGEGGTGKSVWLHIISSLVPKELRCHLQPHQISHEYYGAKLAGKVLNVVTECRASVMTEESDFKAVISGEPVTRRHIEGSPFDFSPIALHLFSANKLPPSPGASDAYWTRWLPLGFDRKKRGTDGEILELAARIVEEEMEAVLAWVMECGRDILKRKRYTVPSSSAEIMKAWRVGSDSVAAWADEMIKPLDMDAPRSQWISSTHAYNSYKLWARDGGYKEVNRSTFKDRLSELGIANVKSSGVVRFRMTMIGDAPDVGDGDGSPWM